MTLPLKSAGLLTALPLASAGDVEVAVEGQPARTKWGRGDDRPRPR